MIKKIGNISFKKVYFKSDDFKNGYFDLNDGLKAKLRATIEIDEAMKIINNLKFISEINNQHRNLWMGDNIYRTVTKNVNKMREGDIYKFVTDAIRIFNFRSGNLPS